nr:MAG TPA: hypothetical protein [Caudoviricetes sp.]
MMNVTLTIDCSNLTSVRPAILTNKDKKSYTELAYKMANATSECEILELAHKIVNCNKRNARISQNEFNINRIMDYIRENTVNGDIISKEKMNDIVFYQWDSLKMYPNAARYKAVTEAFKRLVNSGELVPTKMRTTEKVGNRYNRYYKYYTVYVVA